MSPDYLAVADAAGAPIVAIVETHVQAGHLSARRRSAL
jgi:hypothetical protein